MLCIYSVKDGLLLLQNKTIIMFLSLVSGSFGSMNKSYMSTFHTAHLFSNILSCNTILQMLLLFLKSFLGFFFFFSGLSTHAQQWQCILIPYFLEYNQRQNIKEYTVTYSEVSQVSQFIQGKKGYYYTPVVPFMNRNIQFIRIGNVHGKQTPAIK